jgi:hypothetical protein
MPPERNFVDTSASPKSLIQDMKPLPPLVEQIAWLRERAADAELLRGLLVNSGTVDPDKAERDAEMWKAVLKTLQTVALYSG